jgi:hypothetical protein
MLKFINLTKINSTCYHMEDAFCIQQGLISKTSPQQF